MIKKCLLIVTYIEQHKLSSKWHQLANSRDDDLEGLSEVGDTNSNEWFLLSIAMDLQDRIWRENRK